MKKGKTVRLRNGRRLKIGRYYQFLIDPLNVSDCVLKVIGPFENNVEFLRFNPKTGELEKFYLADLPIPKGRWEMVLDPFSVGKSISPAKVEAIKAPYLSRINAF